MPLTAEYGTVPITSPVTLAEVTIGRRVYYLRHCPAGYYLAGSAARYQARASYLAGHTEPDGSAHGQHYATLGEASLAFARRAVFAQTRERVR